MVPGIPVFLNSFPSDLMCSPSRNHKARKMNSRWTLKYILKPDQTLKRPFEMQMRKESGGWYFRRWVPKGTEPEFEKDCPGIFQNGGGKSREYGEGHKTSPPTKSPSHKWGPGSGCSERPPCGMVEVRALSCRSGFVLSTSWAGETVTSAGSWILGTPQHWVYDPGWTPSSPWNSILLSIKQPWTRWL